MIRNEMDSLLAEFALFVMWEDVFYVVCVRVTFPHNELSQPFG